MDPMSASATNADENLSDRQMGDPTVPLALSVTDLTKSYGSGFALGPVTFDLPMGRIMGLIGPNGAGKTTLIKLILNMIHRDGGSISVLALDNLAEEAKIKNELGVVFDTGYFSDTWTVKMAGKVIAGMYDTWNQAAFQRYAKHFGLDMGKKVKDLSRGMKMTLMLATALSHDAKLLILDEPTIGLDVLARDKVMDVLRQYVADGRHSVLFSTHITADLEHAAGLITYITKGRLYYTGPKDEFEGEFRLVKGNLDKVEAIEQDAVGIRRFDTDFEALLHRDVALRVLLDGPGLVCDPVSIDDIIRLTNVDSVDLSGEGE